VGIVADWKISIPLADDDSLRYYVLHLHQQPPITLIMLAVGALLGVWIPYPRKGGAAHW